MKLKYMIDKIRDWGPFPSPPKICKYKAEDCKNYRPCTIQTNDGSYTMCSFAALYYPIGGSQCVDAQECDNKRDVKDRNRIKFVRRCYKRSGLVNFSRRKERDELDIQAFLVPTYRMLLRSCNARSTGVYIN